MKNIFKKREKLLGRMPIHRLKHSKSSACYIFVHLFIQCFMCKYVLYIHFTFINYLSYTHCGYTYCMYVPYYVLYIRQLSQDWPRSADTVLTTNSNSVHIHLRVYQYSTPDMMLKGKQFWYCMHHVLIKKYFTYKMSKKSVQTKIQQKCLLMATVHQIAADSVFWWYPFSVKQGTSRHSLS